MLLTLLLRPFRHAFDFKGRSSRHEYFLFLLLTGLVNSSILWFIFEPSLSYQDLNLWPLKVLGIFFLVPFLSLIVRRLQDSGRGSYYYIFPVLVFASFIYSFFVSDIGILGITISFLGFISYIIALCLPEDKGPNCFGEKPPALYRPTKGPLSPKERRTFSLMWRPLYRWLDFSGRSTRKEYWMFFVLKIILSTLSMFVLEVNDFLDQTSIALSAIFLLFFLIFLTLPDLAVLVRRLHDSDRSGFWALLTLIPLVGFFIWLRFTCLSGTKGPNRFGPDPLGRDGDISQSSEEKPKTPETAAP